jgi:anaerobic ribonucleoside-triphosphate reductase
MPDTVTPDTTPTVREPKYEVTIPMAGIRTGKDGRYCDACGAKLNKHTPRRCPQCDWDLWTRATEKRL